MKFPYGLSIEECVVYELARIAVQLHKNGMIRHYRQLVEARDALLLSLDEGEKLKPARKGKRAPQRRNIASLRLVEGDALF